MSVIKFPGEGDRNKRKQSNGGWPPRKPKNHQPILNLPPGVKYFAGALFVVHLVMFLLPYLGMQELALKIKYFGAFQNSRIADGDLTALFTPVTSAFLHSDWFHLGMNTLWLLVFGSAVEKSFGTKNFGLISIGSAIGGKFLFYLLAVPQASAIGASGVTSGLMAAVCLLMYRGSMIPSQGIKILVGLFLFFNLIWVPMTGAKIAWQSHIGGFLAGGALMYALMNGASGRR
ncbi:MAG: rhomboid family intramembrane serine protease [Alphaproteobacteria bacterium]